MLLVIDNYDSFTYNLVQYLGEMQVDMQVHRNDQISIEQIRRSSPSGSSSHRARARRANPACPTRSSAPLARASRRFGVCLGHQCIGHVFGGECHRQLPHDARQNLAH